MMEELNEVEALMAEESLADWVIGKRQQWRNFYDSNYRQKDEEYYRLWRGQWASEDQTRDTERCQLISPALQTAVEENAAEIEEATFGRGSWFDIQDDWKDDNKVDIGEIRKNLHEDFAKARVKQGLSECILNAAWSGQGTAEVVLDEILDQKPATEEMMGGDLMAVGVETTMRPIVKLRPVQPANVLNDPNATTVDDGIGIILDEFVGDNVITEGQEAGIYRDVYVGTALPDSDLEPDQLPTIYTEDRVQLTRYYGKVPRDMLEAESEELEEDEELVEFDEKKPDESYYVEAIVILANDTLIKAEANPYMMKDRPVVSFSWDPVPGRFRGRGVCEKGYNSQKALDAEIRARVDALALTIHPMMAMDATRMPRGMKPKIQPGKTIATQGDPREILQAFNFGNVDQITFAQAGELQKMVQSATGAINAAGMPTAAAGGDASAGAVSMSMGAVLKRHKRTLINFQENLLIPFVCKAAWRYMQFDPERYPANDYKFNCKGSLGMVQREYEVGQLTQLLQTISPDSPIYPALVTSVVENMSLANREELVETLAAASEPDPEQLARQQAQFQQEMQFKQGQIGLLEGQKKESEARAFKYQQEGEAVPFETANDAERVEMEKARAAAQNMVEGTNDDGEFERRMRVLGALQDERRLALEEKVGQSNAAQQAHAAQQGAAAQAEAHRVAQQGQQDLGAALAPAGAPPNVGA